MQGTARWFFTSAVLFALAGMALGIRMGVSHNHDQIPTHAHVMLVGWVNAALMGFFYHQFPVLGAARLAHVHFVVQTAGAVVMTGSLWLIYGGNEAVRPGAAIGSIGVTVGMLIFAYTVLRHLWRR